MSTESSEENVRVVVRCRPLLDHLDEKENCVKVIQLQMTIDFNRFYQIG